MILLLVILILFIGYSFIIVFYWLSWKEIAEFTPSMQSGINKFSVVIPARNEEKNIAMLLEALMNQEYPIDKVQIIVVDDHSNDSTATIAANFDRVQVLSLKDENINSYKKKAIELGINESIHKWIITTDADCIPGSKWLATIDSFIQQEDSAIIAAPVSIDCNNSIVQVFESMDFMVLQGITGAAVSRKALSMGNGANLAYKKTAFNEVDGFRGIDHIASGDDMLLMHKIAKRYPDNVHYLKSKNAIVRTPALKTWKQFFNQRIRWASKATYFDDRRIFYVLLLVYLFNLSFFALAITGFFNPVYWLYLAILLIAKTIIELPFFISVARFFDKTWAIKMFFFFQPLHVFYTVVSGLFGQIGKYEWKGRKVR